MGGATAQFNKGSNTGGNGAQPASLLGGVGRTTRSGTVSDGGNTYTLYAGEDIFGPFEAGFSSRQNSILEGLGCSNGNLGHVAGGIDTETAEALVAHQCNIDLPRVENGRRISLLDSCGGHTMEYHFHERLRCLYSDAGTHSPQVGEAFDGKPIYGKWEDAATQTRPLLDACGGHWGFTPDSPDVEVYHYHVQDSAPFIIGCFGPNEDNSLVTVEQCRSLYTGCNGNPTTLVTDFGAIDYELWCPCYDANGSNHHTASLPVFSYPELAAGPGADVVQSVATTSAASQQSNTGAPNANSNAAVGPQAGRFGGKQPMATATQFNNARPASQQFGNAQPEASQQFGNTQPEATRFGGNQPMARPQSAFAGGRRNRANAGRRGRRN